MSEDERWARVQAPVGARPYADVKVRDVVIGRGRPLVLISGPCVIEDEDTVMRTAERVREITARLGMPLIFKSSFEKDNRGKRDSYIGPGRDEGLAILARVRERFGVPVLSDVHREADVEAADDALDVLQIPAYLCQQTSLVTAVAETGKPVNIKKGQFLAPETMDSAVSKCHDAGNRRVLLTERGACFGYNRLVSDLRCIPIMQDLGCPVVYDPTHIVRVYGVSSARPEGGEPQFVPVLTRAAVAAGANALFIETHPDRRAAKCDAASMLDLDLLEPLLRQVVALAALVREWGVA
jgi:2-dehydro-3-deoxyphosphooctonate aldolase (KDO 8-P synthase)